MSRIDGLVASLMRGCGGPIAEADAAEFLARAEHHGVAPLLHEALEAAPAATVDAAVRDGLRRLAVRAAAVELRWHHELPRVLRRFTEHGIVPIVLKGTALAYSLYRRPHLRPRMDIDLLVPLERSTQACELLSRDGYAGDSSAVGRFVRTQVEFWQPADLGLVVDLHWRISTSPMFNQALDYASVRARAVQLPQLDPDALAPCAVDALLHACAHRAARLPAYGAGLEHGDRLVWLEDIRLLAGTLDGQSWQDLLERARRGRLCAICLHAFEAAAAALGCAFPPAVLASLREGARRYEPSATFLTGDRWRILVAELRSLAGAAERSRYLWERALPPPGYVRGKYGPGSWPLPLLYVRHLAEGLRRH